MKKENVPIRKYFEYNTSYFGTSAIHNCVPHKSTDVGGGYDFSGRLSGGTSSCLIQRTADNEYKVVSYGEEISDYISVVKNCVENEKYFINILNTCVNLQVSLGFVVKLFSMDGQLFKITLFPIIHTNATIIVANITLIAKNAFDSVNNEKITVAVCTIAHNEKGERIFASVSPGFSDFFEKSTVVPNDILYCSAVDQCLSTMSSAECKIQAGYHNGDSKSFTIHSIPYYGENGSQNVILNIIPRANAVLPEAGDMPKGITEREQQVINLAAKGCTNRYIAHKLLITEGTVKKTLHNAYKKLGIKSRMELIRRIQE